MLVPRLCGYESNCPGAGTISHGPRWWGSSYGSGAYRQRGFSMLHKGSNSRSLSDNVISRPVRISMLGCYKEATWVGCIARSTGGGSATGNTWPRLGPPRRLQRPIYGVRDKHTIQGGPRRERPPHPSRLLKSLAPDRNLAQQILDFAEGFF
jgi:hypothetical protein